MRRRGFGGMVRCAVENYIEDGLAVFPLSRNSKVPRKGSNGYKDATKSIDEAKELWEMNPGANVGIATGSISELVVIDIDVKNDVDGMKSYEKLCDEYGIPVTRTARTPSGGIHYYFGLPDGAVINCQAGLRPGIDIRGEGGYIVAPPSRIGDSCYEWIDEDVEIQVIPSWLVEKINSPRERRGGPREDIPINALDGVSEGQRNHVLNRYGCSMRARGVKKDEAKVLVLEAAANCNPPFSEDEAIKCLNSAWTYDPNCDSTEIGNADRLISLFKDNLMYVEGDGWYAFDDKKAKWIFGKPTQAFSL